MICPKGAELKSGVDFAPKEYTKELSATLPAKRKLFVCCNTYLVGQGSQSEVNNGWADEGEHAYVSLYRSCYNFLSCHLRGLKDNKGKALLGYTCTSWDAMLADLFYIPPLTGIHFVLFLHLHHRHHALQREIERQNRLGIMMDNEARDLAKHLQSVDDG